MNYLVNSLSYRSPARCSLLIIGLLISSQASAQLRDPTTPPCAPPVESVAMDLHSDAKFAYTAPMRVINLYWWDGWDKKPGHENFQMADIDAATRTLINSPYLRHTCQYGSPQVLFDRGADTSGFNACPNHGPPTSRPIPTDIDAFLTCEEAMPFTNVPMVHGVPTLFIPGAPSVCGFCGEVLPCFVDPPCRVSPNPTGDLLINLFVPSGHRPFQSECRPYHFQTPTWALGWPAAPLPGTQARPIYYTVIPTDCYTSGTETTLAGNTIAVTAIDRMMVDVGHEMIEVLTDEMPGAFWYNRAGQPGDTVADHLEAADVCEDVVRPDGSGWVGRTGAREPQRDFRTLRWTDSKNVAHQMILHGYWSNKDHACIAPVSESPPTSSGSLLREENGTIWVIFGGARFAVPDLATFKRLYEGMPITRVPTGGVNHIPTVPADGTLLREENGTIWAIFGGARLHIPDVPTLTRLFADAPIFQVWNGALTNIPTVPLNNTLLREENGTIWVIFGGARFHVPDVPTLTHLYAGVPIFQVWNGALASVPTVPVSGTLLREENGTIWAIFGGARFHVPDVPTLARLYSGTPIAQLWDGAPAFIPTVPVDRTLLREENGTIWTIFGGARFHVPDVPTLSRLFAGLPIYQVWNGAPTFIPTVPRDRTLLREENGTIWAILGGARFHVPDVSTLTRLFAGARIFQFWNGAADIVPTMPANGTFLREENGTIWAIFGGARFHVPDVPTLTRLFAGAPIFQLWNGAPTFIPTVPVDGTLLREENGTIWAIFGGARFHVPDPATLMRLFAGVPIFQLWNGAADIVATIPVNGTLLREENGTIWVIFGGARFHVPDVPTLTRLYDGAPVSQLWNGAPASIPTVPLDRTLLREEKGAIWIIFGGARFHVPDPATLTRLYSGAPIFQLWDGAPNGLRTIPVDGTLLREESSRQVFIIVAGHKIKAPPNVVGSVHVLWDGALTQIP